MASVKNPTPADKLNERACDCGAFQPLFKSNGADGQHGDLQEQEAQIAQARGRGMQNGLESGRKEACRVARSGLSPSLKAFLHTLNDLSLANQRMKEQVSAKVVELALSISERVMGANTRLAAPAMNDLKRHLGDALSQRNGIALHINPADIQAIEALLAAEGMEWPSHPRIDIESDALVPPGELRVADQSVPRASLDSSVLSVLAQLLSKNSHPAT
ncbi:MAG: hypothetical protein HZB87_10720 [Desulfatitalea sp.]|nr:hypothetical protein [Desulfatitalea sp.]